MYNKMYIKVTIVTIYERKYLLTNMKYYRLSIKKYIS